MSPLSAMTLDDLLAAGEITTSHDGQVACAHCGVHLCQIAAVGLVAVRFLEHTLG